MTGNDVVISILAAVAMIAGLVVSFIPVIPGPVLLWGISVIYAVATNFQHVTLGALLVITGLMALRLTSDFWMPLLGMKSRGLACSTVIGMSIGGLIGTFTIPIPIIGSLIGAVAGSLIAELIRVRDLNLSVTAARFALQQFLYAMLLEYSVNITITVIFLASLVIG